MNERDIGKIIIMDTNVLLHIYSYSPEFSEFALRCLDSVKDLIVIPMTVSIEYERHHKKEFQIMSNKIGTVKSNSVKQLKIIKSKLDSVSNELKKLQFTDIDTLEEAVNDYWAQIQEEFDQYFDNRESMLDMLSKAWGKTDRIFELYQELKHSGHIMGPIDQLQMYRLCDIAEKRFKEKQPPGYMDKGKESNALRKYGDYFLWWETIQYVKKNKKDVIFVTDDVKEDWCSRDENGNINLRTELIDEFHKKTSQDIQYMNSRELFSMIAETERIEKSDAVEYALQYTDAKYCKKVAEDVFYKIEDSLIYSDMDYIVTETANIGDLGFEDSFELLDWSYISGIQTNREEYSVCYELIFDVTLAAHSTEYWGRDDETKEVIPSPPSYHEFSGQIKVAITRIVDTFIDFDDDCDFESAEIYEGMLEETVFKPYIEAEQEDGEYYSVCPDCGCGIDHDNDGGNGFCTDCSWKH